ncbi:unnamed protein product [Lampetra fluviatilis]
MQESKRWVWVETHRSKGPWLEPKNNSGVAAAEEVWNASKKTLAKETERAAGANRHRTSVHHHHRHPVASICGGSLTSCERAIRASRGVPPRPPLSATRVTTFHALHARSPATPRSMQTTRIFLGERTVKVCASRQMAQAVGTEAGHTRQYNEQGSTDETEERRPCKTNGRQHAEYREYRLDSQAEAE